MAKVILYKLPTDTNGNILNFYTAADATVDTEAAAIAANGAFTDGTVVTYAIEYTSAEVNSAETAMISAGGAGTVLFGQMPSDVDQVLVKSYAVGLATGNNDDIESIATANFVRVTGPGGAFAIRGIAEGADGVVLSIFNDTSQTMTISNQAAGSEAANRIITGTGGDVAFTGNAVVTLTYSGEKSRWVLTAVSELPSGVGTGTVTSFSAGTTGFSVATATTTPTISGVLNLANGGTGAALVDPNADRILFWDDSAGAVAFLTPGDGLTITTTTIAASAKQVISGGTENATSDRFLHPMGYGPAANAETTAATAVLMKMPFAATVSNLYVETDAAADVGGDTITVYKNGVATALTATIAQGATTASDTSNSFSVVATDTITVSQRTLSGPGSMYNWSFQVTPS